LRYSSEGKMAWAMAQDCGLYSWSVRQWETVAL
jgi:hypothetical protein